VAQLLVVSDTGPLHYLVLTGDIALLPKLFDRVLAPRGVLHNLTAVCQADAPGMLNIITRDRLDLFKRADVVRSAHRRYAKKPVR
jgi:predicted nucleic acid-binding protein